MQIVTDKPRIYIGVSVPQPSAKRDSQLAAMCRHLSPTSRLRSDLSLPKKKWIFWGENFNFNFFSLFSPSLKLLISSCPSRSWPPSHSLTISASLCHDLGWSSPSPSKIPRFTPFSDLIPSSLSPSFSYRHSRREHRARWQGDDHVSVCNEIQHLVVRTATMVLKFCK